LRNNDLRSRLGDAAALRGHEERHGPFVVLTRLTQEAVGVVLALETRQQATEVQKLACAFSVLAAVTKRAVASSSESGRAAAGTFASLAWNSAGSPPGFSDCAHVARYPRQQLGSWKRRPARRPRLRQSVPAIYQYPEFPMAGGLMSYGGSIVEEFQLAGKSAVFSPLRIRPE
jgi:hypothetical protein